MAANQHAVTHLVPGDAGAQLFDHAHRFVADDQARLDGILASNDV
jgi:hypothetical protein